MTTLAAVDWNTAWELPETGRLLSMLVFAMFGFALLYSVSVAANRFLLGRQSPHYAQLMRKLVFYLGTTIILLTVLLELGIDLTGLLATAGIATLALGFAAQTSLSNLISGLFLIVERPFQIGDLVRLNDVTGTVESIDLLSIKIRTLDNQYVRIPNETMLRNPVTTVTRYPIRRMDLELAVACKEDVARVMRILGELARANPYALDDPEPLVLFDSFGDNGLRFRFGLWFEKSNFLRLRNSILREIKERFDREGIGLPHPHVTLCEGGATRPFPVEVRGEKPARS